MNCWLTLFTCRLWTALTKGLNAHQEAPALVLAEQMPIVAEVERRWSVAEEAGGGGCDKSEASASSATKHPSAGVCRTINGMSTSSFIIYPFVFPPASANSDELRDNVLQRTTRLRESILQKAFTGELLQWDYKT